MECIKIELLTQLLRGYNIYHDFLVYMYAIQIYIIKNQTICPKYLNGNPNQYIPAYNYWNKLCTLYLDHLIRLLCVREHA